MFRPNNLAVETVSKGFSSTKIGSNWGSVFAKVIRSSLHFDSFSWNLWAWAFSVKSVTATWILLSSFLLMHSAIVVSSTNFRRSVSATSISSIINKNSHGPSLVPWGTPAGMSLHSNLQSCASLTLCLRHLRKSMIEHLILCGIHNVASFPARWCDWLGQRPCDSQREQLLLSRRFRQWVLFTCGSWWLTPELLKNWE